jgi:hypothetical protein
MADTSIPSIFAHIEKPSPEVKGIIERLTAAYHAGTDADRTEVKKLVERAKSGKRDSAVVTFTSGMAAILFFEQNRQNREWSPSKTAEYAHQIADGEWEWTHQGVGFLESGDVGDGQHRFAGVAISGQPVEMTVGFGMTFGAIIAIDTGKPRQASDFLGIGSQVADAKRKQAMVKQAFATLRRLAKSEEESRPYAIRSGGAGNRDLVKAIKSYDLLLKEAMQIAEESVHGRSKPTFKEREAASFAFLLLLKGWPKARVIADLDNFQSGEDREGGNSPLFVAADQLQKDAQRREGATVAARFAAAIKAFVLHEQGIKAVRISEIRNAMKSKAEVDASFPGTATTHAADNSTAA